MEIIQADSPDQISSIIPVIRSAWGLTDMSQIVKDIVAAMRFHGGLVLLARDGGKIVGMQFSFPGRFGGKDYLYSHMTGVIQDRKYSGIGSMLKLRQKEWAISQGYDLICWTYDPLMTLNANLNLGKLGGIARSYIPDFYGIMDDSLNRGNPTDRVVCEWWITMEKNSPEMPAESIIPNGENKLETALSEKMPFLLRIPDNFLQMKMNDPEKAMETRILYRETFRKIFMARYVLAGFQRETSSYVVVHESSGRISAGPSIFPVR